MANVPINGTAEWRHVDSANNPADIIYRGIQPSGLPSCKIWWNGPNWLKEDIKNWPQFSGEQSVDVDIPEKRNPLIALSTICDINIFDRYSSLFKLKRVSAYCLYFIKNTTVNKQNKIFGRVNTHEFEESCSVRLK
ncbi:hypothetical protein NQ315_008260 [Exocentrus adspersus]|uniref:Uncharacterized protein n=1 Tax=Exocentrus adspersus TaxID=1586481 RepID=A0AAV8VM96_9CUCU|nr:hypothetical protein NQ315_008260 [Exocentrus adspersus]